MRHYAGFWHNALFDNYGFGHDAHPAVGYLVSALFGIGVIAAAGLALYGVLRLLRARSHPASNERERAAA